MAKKIQETRSRLDKFLDVVEASSLHNSKVGEKEEELKLAMSRLEKSIEIDEKQLVVIHEREIIFVKGKKQVDTQ